MGSSAKMIAGCAGQRAGHGDALLLAAGELARAVPQPVAQADGADHAVEPRRVGLPAGEVERQRDVLQRGERRDQVEGLEDEADLVAPELGQLLVVSVGEVGAADVHLAGGERVEAGHAVHQRGLARARRAHDRGEPPAVEVDGDAVEGAHLGVARAVDLGGVQRAGGRHGVGGGVGEVMVMARTVPASIDRGHEGCPRGDQGHPEWIWTPGFGGGPPVGLGAVTPAPMASTKMRSM